MKTKLAHSALLLLLFVATVVFGRQPEGRDRCTDWIGHYGGGVSYRYCKTYLGEDQWSPDYDCYQFKNDSSHRVAVTCSLMKGDDSFGSHQSELNPHAKGALVALPPGVRLKSIEVHHIAN